MRWNPHPGAQAEFFNGPSTLPLRPDGFVWSPLFHEYVHPRSVFAIATQGWLLRVHSRFDVGHEMVLPERGWKGQR